MVGREEKFGRPSSRGLGNMATSWAFFSSCSFGMHHAGRFCIGRGRYPFRMGCGMPSW